jgi:hypothetical protein
MLRIFLQLMIAFFMITELLYIFTLFKKERSTITASVEIQSRVSALMDQDQYVAMASLDLSAAFDVVNVDLLLVRQRKIGLPTNIINLLESWLKDRQCYVEVRNSCSQYFDSDDDTV